MKYLKYTFNQVKKFIKGTFIIFISLLFAFGILFISIINDENSLNPFDYCNLTEIEYKAILHDDLDRKANVEITEYITFDVHAASQSDLFKEVWRELPEEYVDGLKVTYDVKSVSQILPDGTEIPYKETSKMYWEDEDYTQSSTYYWHHSKGSGRHPDDDESLLIYIPWTYRDKLKFKIVYSMNNAALKYNDCSELYLSMYSGNTIKKLKSFKADILIPNEIMPSTYNVFTFGTSKDRIPFNESDSKYNGYHTFSIDLNKDDLKFNFKNRYIEFCLVAYGEDKHIFTKYAPNNKYSNDNVYDELIDENNYYTYRNTILKKYKIKILLISACASIFIIIITLIKYNRLKKKYPIYKSEYEYDIYKYIPSDLDPIFASELVFINDPFNENIEKGEEYAAILLSLVRKKYVTISKKDEMKDWDNDNTLITLQSIQSNYTNTNNSYEPIYTIVNSETGETLEPLTTSERLYLELIEKYARVSNNIITVTEFQIMIDGDYENAKKFIKDIEKKPALENGVMLGYFRETKYDASKKKLNKQAKASAILAILILIIGNIISYFRDMEFSYGAYTILFIILIWRYFFLKRKAGEFVLFTQFGANEQAKWRGLYNYLNSDTFKNEKSIIDPYLLEKYLIYATAFGISQNVIDSIKINIHFEAIERSSILNSHCYTHSSHFHSTSRSFGHSIHTSSRGGGFGGHGYGGGGRGGGGGGGGH